MSSENFQQSRTPPIATTGFLGWIRLNLFSSWFNSILTIFVIYLLLLFVSFSLKNGVLLYAWIIPMIIGQPFLRLFLLAEHGFCDLTSDMTKNSRTTKTNFLVRFFMWNMNYHTEHHSTPGIPFHKLKEHKLSRPLAAERGAWRPRSATLPAASVSRRRTTLPL